MNRRTKKSTKKTNRKRHKNTNTRRNRKMKGGDGSVVFPASFSNNVVDVSPQSYLPYNNFANDPGYSVISSSNTGPFLTGFSTGGSKKRRNSRMQKKFRLKTKSKSHKMRGGGGELSSTISSNINTLTNSMGVVNLPMPAINELSGVSGVMSGFTNTGSSYNPVPSRISPLA